MTASTGGLRLRRRAGRWARAGRAGRADERFVNVCADILAGVGRGYPYPPMRLSHLFFATLRDDPADAEMPSHRLLLRAGYVRQLGSGHLLAAAARQAGQRPGRAGHPRGAGPHRRPGDGDAGRPPGRRLAGQRPLRRDRAGARPVQGPQRPGHGPGDDPRGGRRAAPGRHRQVVPPAADAGLPLPDEVARRAAGPRRPHPRPRVRHEGRLQLRPRRGRPRRELLGPARRVRPDVRAARARDRSPSAPTSG